MAAANPPVPAVVHAQGPSFWDKYKRDFAVIVVAVIVSFLLILLVYNLFLTPPGIDKEELVNADLLKMVTVDAYWFHVLYMRWTGVDWFLTFLATGTALSAVLKNSVSVKSGAAQDLSRWDLALVALAIFAVLGTTFDGKLHAGQLADKYRAGDLILQKAKIEYAASDRQDAEKQNKAKNALRDRWLEAQNILLSTSPVPQITPDINQKGSGATGATGAETPKSQSPNSPSGAGAATGTTVLPKPQASGATAISKPALPQTTGRGSRPPG